MVRHSASVNLATEASTTSVSWQDFTSLTFTPKSGVRYMVFAKCNLRANNQGDHILARLYDSSASIVYSEARNRVREINDNNPHQFMGIIAPKTGSPPTDNVIKLQYCTNNAGTTCYINEGSIFVMELTSNDYYNSSSSGSTTSTTYQNAVRVSMSLSSTKEFIVFASMQLNQNDTSYYYYKANLTDGTYSYSQLAVSAINNTVNRFPFTSIIRTSLTSGTKNIDMQYANFNSGGTVYYYDAYVVAIDTSDGFNSTVQWASDTSASQVYADSTTVLNKLTTNKTLTSGNNYYIFACETIANGSVDNSVFAIQREGTTNIPSTLSRKEMHTAYHRYSWASFYQKDGDGTAVDYRITNYSTSYSYYIYVLNAWVVILDLTDVPEPKKLPIAWKTIIQNSKTFTSAWEVFIDQWNYRGRISFGSGTSGANKQVLVQLENGWGSLFYYADCKSGGDDLRFYDPDGAVCKYFIEEWNTGGYTYVWVEVPKSGATYVDMYWGNSTAPKRAEAWAGKIYLPSLSNTISGWTNDTTYDNKYPLGASSFGGTGGSLSHLHTAGTLGTGNISPSSSYRTTSGTLSSTWLWTNTAHNHGFSGNTSSPSHEPPYRTYALMRNSVIPALLAQSLVVLADATISQAGYSRYSTGDNKFIKFNTTPGTTGGSSSSHTHTIDSTNGPTMSSQRGSSTRTVAVDQHKHTGTTAGSTIVFPNVTTLLYELSSASAIIAGIGALFDVLPPLGWTRKSAWDGYHLFGSSTPGTTTSASNVSHLHTATAYVSGPTFTQTQYYVSFGSTDYYYTSSHTHTFSGSTGTTDATLAYVNMLIGIRNSSDVTITGIAALSYSDSITLPSAWKTIINNSELLAIAWNVVINNNKLLMSEWAVASVTVLTSAWKIEYPVDEGTPTCWHTVARKSDTVNRTVVGNATLWSGFDSNLNTFLPKGIITKKLRLYYIGIYEDASTDNILLLYADPPYHNKLADWKYKFLTSDTGLMGDTKTTVSMAMSPDGKIHVVYIGTKSSYYPNLRVKYIRYNPSTDTIEITKDICENSTYEMEDPYITTDDDNYAHIVWSGKGWGTYPSRLQICYVRSDESYKYPANPPTLLSDSDTDNYRGHVDVDEDDSVWVHWQDGNVRLKKKVLGSWQSTSTWISSAVLVNVDRDRNGNFLYLYSQSGNLYVVKYYTLNGNWSKSIIVTSNHYSSGHGQIGSWGGNDGLAVYYYNNGTYRYVNVHRGASHVELAYEETLQSFAGYQDYCIHSFARPQRGMLSDNSYGAVGNLLFWQEKDNTPVSNTIHTYVKLYDYAPGRINMIGWFE